MEEGFLDVMFGILITASTYMIGPIIFLAINKEEITEKKSKKIATINSIVVACIYVILFFMTSENNPQLPKFISALFYGYINYLLLSKRAVMEKHNNTVEEGEEQEKLDKLIEILEKENMK